MKKILMFSSSNSIKRTFVILLSIIIFLLLAHTALRLYAHFEPTNYPTTLFQRFNLDSEANIPTWFSTIELFLISIFAFMIFHIWRTNEKRKFHQNIWLIFSLFYLFLSMDEAGRIHELLDNQLHIKWVYFYAPVAFLFFALLISYFFKERKINKINKQIITAGLITFAFGSLFVEFLDFYFQPSNFIEQIEILTEEGMEMLGSALIILGLLNILHTKIDIKSLLQKEE